MIPIAELETSVIAGVLYDNATLTLLPDVETMDFQTVRGQDIWSAIRFLEAANKPIDVVMLMTELARADRACDEIREYLDRCFATLVLPYSTVDYAKELRDASVKRRVRMRMAELIEASQSDAISGADLLTMAMGDLGRVDIGQPDTARQIGEIVRDRMAQLEQIAEDRINGKSLTGYPTGVQDLDDFIGGWQPGIVSIVAARPGMGKSSLGLATADGCSAAGFGVHLFSLEDTESAYADRSIARTSKVSAEDIRNVRLNRGQMMDITSAIAKLHKRSGWLVDGRSGIAADEIVRSVRRHAKDNKTKVVIVDYIQLVKRMPGRASSHESLTEIVTQLADAAKQDGLAYVVMSQLNREVETRSDKRPVMSDLRESGSLEERAKCVIALYRDAVYNKTNPDQKTGADRDRIPWANRIELLVLKNSNGRTGNVDAKWTGETTRIE